MRALVSGVVTGLSADIGTTVAEGQEVAMVRAPDGSISSVTALLAGAITNLPVPKATASRPAPSSRQSAMSAGWCRDRRRG